MNELLSPFLLKAFLFGVGLVLVMAPLGCLVVWNRMSFYSDVLAHGSLLGAALGILLSVPPNLMLGIMILIAVACWVVPILLKDRMMLPSDTMLAVVGQLTLVLAILSTEFVGLGQRASILHAILFGDILSISRSHLVVIAVLVTLLWGSMRWWWNVAILDTINKDLAFIEFGRLRVVLVRTILAAAVVTVVATGLQAVGGLIASAFLILPVATARPWASSPHMMVMIATAIGIVATALGIVVSVLWDTPTGPTIMMIIGLAFVVSIGRTFKKS